MMMSTSAQTIKVFCVDDNSLIAEAVQLQLRRAPDLVWHGCAPDAGTFLQQIKGNCPDIVLLDIDMPGKNPFDAISELEGICTKARVLMYSGLIRQDLLDKALDAGAWGYVAKSDGEAALVAAIRTVAAGMVGLSPSIESLYS